MVVAPFALSHRFLLHANRSIGLVQKRAAGVLESVPAKAVDNDLFAPGHENLRRDDATVVLGDQFWAAFALIPRLLASAP